MIGYTTPLLIAECIQRYLGLADALSLGGITGAGTLESAAVMRVTRHGAELVGVADGVELAFVARHRGVAFPKAGEETLGFCTFAPSNTWRETLGWVIPLGPLIADTIDAQTVAFTVPTL
jgi:hypothetical protein